MVFLTVQNLGSAMADVVVDAMIAEAVRYDKYVSILNSFYSLSADKLLHNNMLYMHFNTVDNPKIWDHMLGKL